MQDGADIPGGSQVFLFDSRDAGNANGCAISVAAPTPNFRLTLRTGSTTHAVNDAATAPVRGTFYVTAMTWEAGALRFYLDGVAEGTPDLTTVAPLAQGSMRIGAAFNNTLQPDAIQNRFLSYGRALSPSEIATVSSWIHRKNGLL